MRSTRAPGKRSTARLARSTSMRSKKPRLSPFKKISPQRTRITSPPTARRRRPPRCRPRPRSRRRQLAHAGTTASPARATSVVGGEARQRQPDRCPRRRARRWRAASPTASCPWRGTPIPPIRTRRAARARAGAARPARRAKPTDRMCGAVLAGSPLRRADGSAAAIVVHSRSRCASMRRADSARASAASSQARPSATIPGTPSVPGRSPRSCPPPNTSGRARAPFFSHSAPAPLGPWILCAEIASESNAASATSTASLPIACTASTCTWQRGARALTARAIASTGCTVPISFCTSMQATSAVSGAHRGGERLRRHHAARRRRDDRHLDAALGERLGRVRHRRMLEPRDDHVLGPRRHAADDERVGLGPARGEGHLGRRPAERRRHLRRARAPRAAPPRRRACAPTTDCPTRDSIASIAACATRSSTRVVAPLSR